jgi:hypothetical protein
MDRKNHEPLIAYHVCSLTGGATPGSCKPEVDELRVTQRILGQWRGETVDSEGGMSIRLGVLPSGKRVVAYRDPRSGAVKLAVER